MTKAERALREEIDRAGESLERWFRKLNRAMTGVNDARSKLKRLHKKLLTIKAPRPKPAADRAGVIPIITNGQEQPHES